MGNLIAVHERMLTRAADENGAAFGRIRPGSGATFGRTGALGVLLVNLVFYGCE